MRPFVPQFLAVAADPGAIKAYYRYQAHFRATAAFLAFIDRSGFRRERHDKGKRR